MNIGNTKKNKFYITTAIAYVNAPPHMGHAFQFTRADAIARYRRLAGDDVFFLTGTDEYGSKMFKTAVKEKITPQGLADKNSQKFRELNEFLNISFDDFIRTSDEKRHWPGAQLIWKKINETGDLYKKKYSGYYCNGCEAYALESELINGKCVYHNQKPEFVEEENYFFKLSKYADKLMELIEKNEIEIIPESRKKEILNFAKQGLKDVSFSRPKNVLPWGISVPNDEKHVMYVWCDALANYISALGYGSDDLEKFNKYWPADDHVIGKDNLRFHALYWPAMLLSASLPLPKQIYVHGFIISEGKKMSKTIGNIVDPKEIAEKYGADALRYYLLKEIPATEDGDFTVKHFEEVYNADLANGLGNTVARVISMAEKYFKNEIAIAVIDKKWKEIINVSRECVDYAMKDYNTSQALAGIWHILREIDEEIDRTKPWEMAKTDINLVGAHLFNWLNALRDVGYLLRPFLPETAEKIIEQLGFDEKKGFGAKKGEILFPRI